MRYQLRLSRVVPQFVSVHMHLRHLQEDELFKLNYFPHNERLLTHSISSNLGTTRENLNPLRSFHQNREEDCSLQRSPSVF